MDTMLHWLAAAARDAREAQGRKQVHVAASLGLNQETIGRFERARTWPRDPDAIIAAYADDLGIEPIDLWEDALRRWRAASAGPR